MLLSLEPHRSFSILHTAPGFERGEREGGGRKTSIRKRKRRGWRPHGLVAGGCRLLATWTSSNTTPAGTAGLLSAIQKTVGFGTWWWSLEKSPCGDVVLPHVCLLPTPTPPPAPPLAFPNTHTLGGLMYAFNCLL